MYSRKCLWSVLVALCVAGALVFAWVRTPAASKRAETRPQTLAKIDSGLTKLPESTRANVDRLLDYTGLGDCTGPHDDEGVGEFAYLLRITPREDLVLHLVQVLGDEKREWHARQRAAACLALTKDPRGAAVTLKVIHDYLKPRQEMLTFAECQVLYTCIYNLGRYGTDDAVDEAFKMLSIEYWEYPGVPVLRQSQGDLRFTIHDYREAALIGLSYAGTDRAVRAFETGQGIPPYLIWRNRGSMPYFLKEARKAQQERRSGQAGDR